MDQRSSFGSKTYRINSVVSYKGIPNLVINSYSTTKWLLLNTRNLVCIIVRQLA